MSPTISVIIADDEPVARQLLAHFLAEESDFQLLGDYGDGQAALRAVAAEKPDLVLLDIEMPGLSGIDLVSQLEAPLPLIVFVTAYHDYAIKAFEENALDYILKPFDQDRFQKTLERIREQLKQERTAAHDQVNKLMTAFEAMLGQQAGKGYLKKISCKQKGKIRFLPVDEILWVESEGAFCKLHLERGMELTNLSIKRLEQLLDPATHLRIHKSHMVNIDAIESIEPYFHGEYMINLINGKALKLSRGYKDRLERIINQYK
ncbi:MAG: response regulator transcription factor [Roseivirga sp.]|nr:response regulator transcription factor [Roseivirga sp.]